MRNSLVSVAFMLFNLCGKITHWWITIYCRVLHWKLAAFSQFACYFVLLFETSLVACFQFLRFLICMMILVDGLTRFKSSAILGPFCFLPFEFGSVFVAHSGHSSTKKATVPGDQTRKCSSFNSVVVFVESEHERGGCWGTSSRIHAFHFGQFQYCCLKQMSVFYGEFFLHILVL
jgi:hypothetical protein